MLYIVPVDFKLIGERLIIACMATTYKISGFQSPRQKIACGDAISIDTHILPVAIKVTQCCHWFDYIESVRPV